MGVQFRKQSERRLSPGIDALVSAWFTTSALLGILLTVLLFFFGAFFFWAI
jgi:hypothetical protein